MEAKIGINQRIPIEAIELAVKAVLEDRYDNEYAAELARMEYSGENRIKKAVNIINRLTKNNILMPFLKENERKVKMALKNPNDRGMICIALVNAAYPFCYDVTALLGKYFHAQKEIGSPLIIIVNYITPNFFFSCITPNYVLETYWNFGINLSYIFWKLGAHGNL